MQIKLDKKFEKEFKDIVDFIAKDKISASKKFKNSIINQIEKIPDMPYKHRQSIYFDNKDIRDMIFKGYTIVYQINKKLNCIKVISIFNKK